MITVSVFDVYIPNMFKATSALIMFNYTCFLSFGVCAQILLQQYLPEPEMMQITANNNDNDDSILPSVDPVSQTKYQKVQQRRKRLGLILAITLAAHNFPEGLAVAISSLESTKFGFIMTLVIAMHNIPEGLAVGVLFGGVAAGIPEASIGGAVALAIGIGIQNFPEGIAVAMPLRRSGLSKRKSFWYGQMSAIVEPIAGVIGALAVTFFTPILPYALAFAAGAMIFVVVEEVIPETQLDKYTDIATLGFIGGFIVMMTLDVALG